MPTFYTVVWPYAVWGFTIGMVLAALCYLFGFWMGAIVRWLESMVGR